MKIAVKMNPKTATLKNLSTFARCLSELAERRPEIKRDFDMRHLGVYDGLRKSALKTAYSNGCLLGNAARCFKVKDEYFCFGFSYYLFGRDKFPALYDEDGMNNRLWDFLFSPTWGRCQPSFDEAMRRLNYLIKHKLEIGDWEYRQEAY